jgi:hypothetical protein
MMDYKTMHGFAQGLLDDMPAFVVVADSENGTVLMQNSYAERIFGAINRIDGRQAATPCSLTPASE